MPLSKKFGIDKIAKRHFLDSGPGTLVTNPGELLVSLAGMVLKRPSVGGVQGQMLVPIPVTCISPAYTLLKHVDEKDIKAVWHRGHLEFYVPRGKYQPVPVIDAFVVLYTRQSVIDDPDWDGILPETPYVIITVVGNVEESGDPVSPLRFAANLAGGNNRYLAPEYIMKSAREEAGRVAAFAEKYMKIG